MTRYRAQIGRLVLDPFIPAAARDLYAVRNHASVRKFMARPGLIPYRSHQEWMRTHLGSDAGLHLWLVRPAAGARAIGFTQLKTNASGDTAEIGVMFREPERHRLPAALATAVTLHLAYAQLGCTWVISYVLPSHQQAIDFNLAWGASIVTSDRPGLVLLRLHRDTCVANANYDKIMQRLSGRLTIDPIEEVR